VVVVNRQTRRNQLATSLWRKGSNTVARTHISDYENVTRPASAKVEVWRSCGRRVEWRK
jgi:hypothetical protein